MSIYLGNTKIFNPQTIRGGDIEKENLYINRQISTYTDTKVTKVRSCAFYNCYSLQLVDLSNVSYIGSFAFTYCRSLQSIDLPMASYIGYNAFCYCSSLQSVNLPNASHIGKDAFYNCSSLQTANLPSASYIGSYAFQYCYSLQSVDLPNASYIGNSAFYQCFSLQSVDLPNASYIGSSAFYQCSSLQFVNLPMASYIGSSAFQSCTSLQSVNLPMASYIGSYAFIYCYNLLSFYLDGTSVCSLYASNAFRSTPISGYTASTGGVYGSIFVPASLYSNYITANNWSYYSSRIASLMGTVTWGHISADGQRYAQVRDTEGNVKSGIVTVVTPDGTTLDYQEGTYICDEATWDALSPDYGYSRPATFTVGISSHSLVLLRSDYNEPFIGTLAI